MKIWLLTTEYPPFFGGGIATYCVHTARMLTSFGHEITVFVCDSSIEDKQRVSVDDGVRVVRFKPGISDAYNYLGYHAALSWDFSEIVLEFIRNEGKPDAIESQDYLGISYFLLLKRATLWPELEKVPVALTLHTPSFISHMVLQSTVYRFPEFWIGEMERFTIRAADAIAAPSQFILDQLGKNVNLDGVNSSIIRDPFVLETGRESDQNVTPGTDEVVFVGRLQYLKGVVHALNYFAELWDKGSPVTLMLTGGDAYFYPKNMMMSAYLQKKFRKYFAEGRVTWEGLLSNEKFDRIRSRARVVLMPSLFESFPYVVLESMALGKVVLASDSGGQKEIIEDGKSGFLFSHDDPESFKRRLLPILNMSDDEIKQIGQSAKRRVSALCSYESVYPTKIGLLQRISEKKKASRSFPIVRERKKVVDVKHEEYGASPPGTNALLSIVIPYYNMGAYVKDTLDSLVKSSYPNKEIIIVNDGSDDPDSIAALYQLEKDYPVKVVHKRNAGLATTRNTGARAANGEFLTFLDPDDMVAPDYYEWGIRVLNSYDNVSFVGCWTQYFGAQQAIWPAWNPEPPYLLVHNTMSTSSVVYRRLDFLHYGLNDPKMEYGLEDYETLIRMVEQGCHGVVIPKPLFKWRVRPDSMSQGISKEGMLYLYKMITEKHVGFYQEYAKEVFNLLNSNGPGYLYDNPSRELPPLGFIQAGQAQVSASINTSSAEIPVEVKRALVELWQHPRSRRALKLFFKLHLNKLF